MRTQEQPRPAARLRSAWPVLRAVWAAEHQARWQGGSEGVSIEEIWTQVLGLREEPMAYATVVLYLRTLSERQLVATVRRGRKLLYRSTAREEVAVEAELEPVFESLLHDDPRLIGLARRMLEKLEPPEAG